MTLEGSSSRLWNSWHFLATKRLSYGGSSSITRSVVKCTTLIFFTINVKCKIWKYSSLGRHIFCRFYLPLHSDQEIVNNLIAIKFHAVSSLLRTEPWHEIVLLQQFSNFLNWCWIDWLILIAHNSSLSSDPSLQSFLPSHLCSILMHWLLKNMENKNSRKLW